MQCRKESGAMRKGTSHCVQRDGWVHAQHVCLWSRVSSSSLHYEPVKVCFIIISQPISQCNYKARRHVEWLVYFLLGNSDWDCMGLLSLWCHILPSASGGCSRPVWFLCTQSVTESMTGTNHQATVRWVCGVSLSELTLSLFLPIALEGFNEILAPEDQAKPYCLSVYTACLCFTT